MRIQGSDWDVSVAKGLLSVHINPSKELLHYPVSAVASVISNTSGELPYTLAIHMNCGAAVILDYWDAYEADKASVRIAKAVFAGEDSADYAFDTKGPKA